MLTKDGSEIKDDVRAYFNTGHKSSNKLYEVAHDGQFLDVTSRLTRPTKRADDAEAAHTVMGTSRRMARHQQSLHPNKSFYELLANGLNRMLTLERSGNCAEMAALSGQLAATTRSVSKDLIYIGEISSPGDHAFCLIASSKIDAKHFQFASVTDFVGSAVVGSALIIDPWLNTVCRASDYLSRCAVKLDKWANSGKRVFWSDGQQGAGWYVPNGEYKTKLAQSPVGLLAF